MIKNIAAITGPESSYPPFISINESTQGTDVIITTRESPTEGKCGRTVDIVLNKYQWQSLVTQVMGNTFKKIMDSATIERG